MALCPKFVSFGHVHCVGQGFSTGEEFNNPTGEKWEYLFNFFRWGITKLLYFLQRSVKSPGLQEKCVSLLSFLLSSFLRKRISIWLKDLDYNRTPCNYWERTYLYFSNTGCSGQLLHIEYGKSQDRHGSLYWNRTSHVSHAVPVKSDLPKNSFSLCASGSFSLCC